MKGQKGGDKASPPGMEISEVFEIVNLGGHGLANGRWSGRSAPGGLQIVSLGGAGRLPLPGWDTGNWAVGCPRPDCARAVPAPPTMRISSPTTSACCRPGPSAPPTRWPIPPRWPRFAGPPDPSGPRPDSLAYPWACSDDAAAISPTVPPPLRHCG